MKKPQEETTVKKEEIITDEHETAEPFNKFFSDKFLLLRFLQVSITPVMPFLSIAIIIIASTTDMF